MPTQPPTQIKERERKSSPEEVERDFVAEGKEDAQQLDSADIGRALMRYQLIQHVKMATAIAPAKGDLWPILKGESSAKKTTDESNVATTVQKRFSASCAKSSGDPSLVRKTTTSTKENKQDVPNKTPICWKSVTRPTSMSVNKRRMRLGLMVASLPGARLVAPRRRLRGRSAGSACCGPSFE